MGRFTIAAENRMPRSGKTLRMPAVCFVTFGQSPTLSLTGLRWRPWQPCCVEARIALAINAVTCLLANSDAFRDAQAHDPYTEPGDGPLPPACTDGLYAAIYFLNQYAETLSHEPLVSRLSR